ncbi:MAG TPA: NAD-glutamate dehydrogenase, partial [Kiloniellaceae bacterium]|nr:NAD-glutamate dehydrogenase [Kiloniellaceae bacterium]
MAIKLDNRLSDLIDRVAQVAKKRHRGRGAAAAANFAQRFYMNVPPDDIRGTSPEDLAGAALSLWSLMAERKPGKPKIRIFTPNVERDGWTTGHTVVEIINDDMPFLVDSVTSALNGLGTEVRLIIHPMMWIKRDGRGRLQKVLDDTTAGGVLHESVMHIEISEQTQEELAPIKERLLEVLRDVRSAVEDWRPMRTSMETLISELEENPPPLPHAEVTEAIAFLKWANDDHFTFLGYRTYHFEGRGAATRTLIDAKSGLGVLRDPEVRVFEGLRNMRKLPPDVRDFIKAPVLLRITKANKRSSVHRPAQMDTVAVKIFDKKGKVCGERLFLGLFTSVAYSRSPRDIPILREKVANVIRRSGFRSGSHDGKALQHILENYPRDELFEIGERDLFDISMGVLHLQERQRTALFLRFDPFERFVSCMVYVPRDRYDTALRKKLQSILEEAYGGEVANYSTRLTDATLAQVHVIVETRGNRIPKVEH